MHKPLLLLTLCLSTTLEAIPLRIPRQSDYDQCSHPFHSFLCHKAPRSRVLQPEGSAIDSVALPPFRPEPTPSTTVPPTRTTSRKPETPSPPLSGENSFLDPTFISKVSTPYFYPKPSIPFTAESSVDSPVVNRIVAQPDIKNEVTVPPIISEKPCGNGHSFHSFLCNPGNGRRRIHTGKRVVEYSLLDAVSITKATSTTEKNVDFPDASFQSPAIYKPPLPVQKQLPIPAQKTTPKSRPPIVITTTTTTTSSPEPETIAATFNSPSFLKPEQQQRIDITQQTEHYKGQDACKHAFHSYLCQPSKSRRRNYGRIPEATFQQPQIITTTTRPLEVPEASQLDAVALKPNQKIPPFQPLSQTEKPFYLPPSTKAPEYLPPSTKAPPTIRTKAPTALPPTTPKVLIVPSSKASIYIPPSTKAPEYLPPTTTTQNPIQPAPSSDIFSGILPPRSEPTNTKIQVIPKENDKCKHAFHSFLCQPATRTRKIVPAASVLEGSLLLPEYRTTTTTKTLPSTTPRASYKPSSTRPPPPPLEEINQVPDSTFQDPQRLAPPRPAANSIQPVQLIQTNTENLCNHPFHSFLCHKAPRARRPIKIN